MSIHPVLLISHLILAVPAWGLLEAGVGGAVLQAKLSSCPYCARALDTTMWPGVAQGLTPVFRLDVIVDSQLNCTRFGQTTRAAYRSALANMVEGALTILSGTLGGAANATATCEDAPQGSAPGDLGKKRIRVRVWARSAMGSQQAMDAMSLFGSAAAWGYYASLVEAFGGAGWPVQLFLYAKDTGTAPLCIENISGTNCNNGPWAPDTTEPF